MIRAVKNEHKKREENCSCRKRWVEANTVTKHKSTIYMLKTTTFMSDSTHPTTKLFLHSNFEWRRLRFNDRLSSEKEKWINFIIFIFNMFMTPSQHVTQAVRLWKLMKIILIPFTSQCFPLHYMMMEMRCDVIWFNGNENDDDLNQFYCLAQLTQLNEKTMREMSSWMDFN